jgi:hypothetical protein
MRIGARVIEESTNLAFAEVATPREEPLRLM